MRNQKVYLIIVLAVILISVTVDMITDWQTGSKISHIFLEMISAVAVLFGILVLWKSNEHLKKKLDETKQLSEKWRAENAQLIKGLSDAIDKQFEDWKLSPSEKDIALLLLKGLSLKDIAEIRSVSERTVRQQSVNLYQKSGLAGRAELSAYFLEDLLK